MIKEDNFVLYWLVPLEFVVPVLRPIQKCSCFVSVWIPAVPELFRAYRDKYRVSAVKYIPDETEKLRKPLKFQDPPPHSYLGFPPLLHICLCYAFLLLFLCFAGLCFYNPFIFFIYFSTCLSLFLVLVRSPESRKVVSQEASDMTLKQNVWR